jgi:uncharacterized protein YjbI with pentapeptide repeats
MYQQGKQERIRMANQEQLDLLAQGVAAWNQWKEATSEVVPDVRWNRCYDADLSDANLSGTDLSGINLGNCDLSRVNFSGASLVGASLSEAELLEANFSGACLRGADLSLTNACGVDFRHADLWETDLRHSDLSEACFLEANLSRANLSDADLGKASFEDADLSDANVSGVFTLFNQRQIRQMKRAGASIETTRTHRPSAKIFSKRNTQDQEIILFSRVNSNNVFSVLAGSFLFTLMSFWILQHPENLIMIVIGILALIFFGGGGMIILLLMVRQWFSHTPLLVINEEGIQFFCPVLARLEDPRKDIMHPWKEIGAIGVIRAKKTNSLVVYTLNRRWRSNWLPSLRLSERLLPISATRVIALLQEHYQAQIDAHHITVVELVDTIE